MFRSSRKIAVALTLATLIAATVSIARASSATDVIRARQQGLKDMGAALKFIRDQLRQTAPDMAGIQSAGEKIKTTAEAMGNWFPPGTGSDAGIETAAKAEVWSDAGTFAKKRTDLVAAAGAFAKVSASADRTAIAGAVSALNRTCKGCHDMFFED